MNTVFKSNINTLQGAADAVPVRQDSLIATAKYLLGMEDKAQLQLHLISKYNKAALESIVVFPRQFGNHLPVGECNEKDIGFVQTHVETNPIDTEFILLDFSSFIDLLLKNRQDGIFRNAYEVAHANRAFKAKPIEPVLRKRDVVTSVLRLKEAAKFTGDDTLLEEVKDFVKGAEMKTASMG